ncbi:MAG: TRAP transporter small permease [Burkholderiaceae bacterium]
MQDAALGDALDAPNEPQLGPWGLRIHALTRAFAIAGGIGFIVLVLMSLISIVGRKLASTPITGDIELMQMAGAVAAAAMLPFCEMERHHLRVDFFTTRLPQSAKHRLDAISHVLLALVALLVAWRTGVGAASLREAGEASMMLLWPVWTVVAALVPSFLLLSLAGFYNAVLYWRASGSAA